MANFLGPYLAVAGASDPETIMQTDLETIAREVNQCLPTFISGAANTITGPPTTGARVVGELWRDKNLALWICTVAGTPGTWKQQAPAVVDTLPTVSIDKYWVIDRADATIPFRQKYYDLGTTSWVNLF